MQRILDALRDAVAFALGWAVRAWLSARENLRKVRQEKIDIEEYVRRQNKIQLEHEKRAVKDVRPLSGNDISRMLSSYPAEDSQAGKTRPDQG